jgi:hypothetical protein
MEFPDFQLEVSGCGFRFFGRVAPFVRPLHHSAQGCRQRQVTQNLGLLSKHRQKSRKPSFDSQILSKFHVGSEAQILNQ